MAYAVTAGSAVDSTARSNASAALSKWDSYIYITNELITCTANTWRDYTFPNLPAHKISIPLLGTASSGCIVVRNFDVTGGVRVFSPVSQNLLVYLVCFK